MKGRSQPRETGGKIGTLQAEANNTESNTPSLHWKRKTTKYCGELIFIIARGVNTQIANPCLAKRNTVASSVHYPVTWPQKGWNI